MVVRGQAMTRDPGPDDGRDEAYDDDGSQAAASGVLIEHRYARPRDQLTERELDRLARSAAMQDMADSGRPVHSVPWWRMARNKASVKHRQWEKRQNGWSHCKRCGFPVPTSDDEIKIGHQEDHKWQDQFAADRAADIEQLIEVVADLKREITVGREEITRERLRINALMLALGHADHDALQAAVEEVMGLARELSRSEAAAREDDDE